MRFSFTTQEWLLGSAAVFICLFPALDGVMTARAASLSDIGSSRNEEAIQNLYEQGIISGYSDGSFKPQNSVNRAELIKILVGATGAAPTVDTYHDCFSDVTTQWFAPFVCYAKEQGWVNGYPDGSFRPEQIVSKVEAIKMLVTSQGYDVSTDTESGTFQDVDTSAWYAPYVRTALKKGLLEEEGENALQPSAGMKRENISENIYRALSIKKSGATRFEGGAQGQGSANGKGSEDLQQYLDAANAAADRTELTKEEFQTALQALMQAGGERMGPPQDQHSSEGSSRPRPPDGQPPHFGQASSGMSWSAGERPEPSQGEGKGPEHDFSNAKTFLKYTDANGQTVLLAIDSSGKVMMKWPPSGRGPMHQGSSSSAK